MVALLAAGAQSFAANIVIPDVRIHQDDYTALMAVDARLAPGLKPFQSGGHGKFQVVGWNQASQQAEWSVRAETAGEYEASVLLRARRGRVLRIELSGSCGKALAEIPARACSSWERVKLHGLLPIPAGQSQITLRVVPADGSSNFEVEVHAVELVRPGVKDALQRRAQALRADPSWFQNARYGIMVHWTQQSMPLAGNQKSYDEAVSAFDVEAFADQVRRTGAGFVVFTTSHAMHYFPAPLASLDRILPGRTTRRDLVADLAGALARRGIRLMLYYHLGASSDPQWMQASGALETDKAKFFANWQAMIGEAGNRYGNKLAGWWFDDGAVGYYYRSPQWELLARAAKAGSAQRLISFNAWELANPTQFHDFCTGEGCQEPSGMGGVLKRGGDGRYPTGTHAGLQASSCLVTESDWGHFAPNAPLSKPKWTADQLAALINGFMAYKSVPIFNLEITQDGQLSPATVQIFEQVARKLGHTAR